MPRSSSSLLRPWPRSVAADDFGHRTAMSRGSSRKWGKRPRASGSGDGRLYMLHLDDGKELWRYDLGGATYSSPAVSRGMILIGANDKRLYAFGAPPDSSGR